MARDRRGRPIGIRTQFVPELSARWATVRRDYLDRDAVIQKGVDWMNSARQALSNLHPDLRSKLSYEQETYFDTRVVGREEYDRASSYTWGDSTLEAELGRRKVALGEQ